MKISNDQLASKLEAFNALKYKFEDAFMEAKNSENSTDIRESNFLGAKSSIRRAQDIVEELCEDDERFPEGLPVLPYNIKWETNTNFTIKRFSKIRSKIIDSYTAH